MLAWRPSARLLQLALLLALAVPRARPDVGLLSNCPTVEEQDLLNPPNKAFLAPITFHGRLLAKWQDQNRNLLVKLRIERVLKNGFSGNQPGRVLDVTGFSGSRSPTRRLQERREVVVAFKRNDSSTSAHDPIPNHRLCGMPLESEQTLLVTNGRYLVYAKPLDRLLQPMFPRANFAATALPDPFSLRAARTIHKAVCDTCALKPASAKARRMRVTIRPLQRLRLRCTVRGNPLPYVHWTKDGKPLKNDNRRIVIRTKRRRARLDLSSVGANDAGEYRCWASNIVSQKPVSTKIEVFVNEIVFERTSPWGDKSSTSGGDQVDPRASSPTCPTNLYCLNGATCHYMESIKEASCVCTEGFQGRRCESKLVKLAPGIGIGMSSREEIYQRVLQSPRKREISSTQQPTQR